MVSAVARVSATDNTTMMAKYTKSIPNTAVFVHQSELIWCWRMTRDITCNSILVALLGLGLGGLIINTTIHSNCTKEMRDKNKETTEETVSANQQGKDSNGGVQ